jgi:metal-responsive CopG/Arc/MetJ family transcriptional regulator
VGGINMPTLKRTQMYFPEDLLNELRRKADREKTTLSHLVRSAVLELIKKDKLQNWEDDPLWRMIGSSQSRDKDLSVNHDTYLYEKVK